MANTKGEEMREDENEDALIDLIPANAKRALGWIRRSLGRTLLFRSSRATLVLGKAVVLGKPV